MLQGGTNFPHEREQQKEFLLNRPFTDVYALFEGERSTLTLVNRYLETQGNIKEFFENPLDGCVFIDPKTKDTNPELINGNYLERIKDLDEIPLHI